MITVRYHLPASPFVPLVRRGCPRDRDGEAGPGERYRDRRTDWLGWLRLPTEPARLDCMPWLVYEVRRVIWPGPTTPPARRTPPRSLHAVAAGNRAQMTAVLCKMAKAEGAGIQDEDGSERPWLRRRSAAFPAAEHFLVAASPDHWTRTAPA